MARSANVRVRFAPSPTGGPHLGNIRTALFNWLLARATGGSFMVRIEDTDQARKVEGAVDEILAALRWLGVQWDEGPDVGGSYAPYYQSQRLDRYHAAARMLVAAGKAYPCYCTPERLRQMRDEQTRSKRNIGYDRSCRGLTPEQRAHMENGGGPSVVRFAMPVDGSTSLDDIVRGRVSFENALVDDFVLLKSDGFPTYHLANVVDDHEMEISHVLRAEEWLSSAPRHMRLYEAFGWNPPLFAHLPIILAPDRSKLSKRHGATAVTEYREMGYLPQAMVNFLALLGWSLDDRTEVFSAAELIGAFSLERVSRSPAVFDADKLTWLNGHYIRNLSHSELAHALLDFWHSYPPDEFPAPEDLDLLTHIAPLIQERLKTLRDAAPLVQFFFRKVDYDPADLVQKRMDEPGTLTALEKARAALEALPSHDTASIEGVLRPLASELGLKTGQLLGALRVATTGLKVAPPLFETMEVLGRDRTLTAIDEALDRLSAHSAVAPA